MCGSYAAHTRTQNTLQFIRCARSRSTGVVRLVAKCRPKGIPAADMADIAENRLPKSWDSLDFFVIALPLVRTIPPEITFSLHTNTCTTILLLIRRIRRTTHKHCPFTDRQAQTTEVQLFGTSTLRRSPQQCECVAATVEHFGMTKTRSHRWN